MAEKSDRVDKLISELTLDEKSSLTSGLGMWSTKPVERLGLPSVRLTDGPNGARGPFHTGEGTVTSACAPCGSALGASWDPALVEEVAALVGTEALRKGSRVLLAPTVNIHRSPIAGRNFECYSEDPLLSGKLAVAFIRGAQSQGVACTVKHFAGNEAEFERGTINSEIDERTLREIYLRPFELAVTEGGALGVMTGYNRLNGTWCAENAGLLADVLRGEWGFDGFVVSDWGGIGSTVGSLRAGLDLEMPGPGNYFGEHLAEAVRRGDVTEDEVDMSVRRLLATLDHVGAFDETPAEPQAIDRPEDRALLRRAASSSMVLLRNDGLLPLDRSAIRSIAVIGPSADAPTMSGGGAANLKPHHRTNITDAVRQRFPDASVRYEPGVDRSEPGPLRSFEAAPNIAVPFTVQVRTEPDGDPVAELVYPDTQALYPEGAPGTDKGPFVIRGEGTFPIAQAGTYSLTLVQVSPATVAIDGKIVIDGVRNPPEPGRFPWLPQPIVVDLKLTEGDHHLVVESSGDKADVAGLPLAGFTIGLRMALDDGALDRAVTAAAEADVALVVVGTDASWETETRDRRHMDLTGSQDELVERVCAANPRTIVVLNTGAPVTLPWADQAPALVQSWFGGQEIAPALVDVLLGDAEPGGRLPVTFPLRLEHNPTFGTFPGENGVLRYGEGVFVGYRWYESRKLPVAFPFGHGLSYTTFELGEPIVVAEDDLTVTVTVDVTNTGDRRGSEVVQCYVAPPTGRRPRPSLELRAFAKVALDAGDTAPAVLELDRRSFSRWDPAIPDFDRVHAQLESLGSADRPRGPRTGAWVVDPGTYELCIGRSVSDIVHRVPFDVGDEAE